MSQRRPDEVVNINVGGKKYTVRRGDLCADPKSRLADWFKPNAVKAAAQDKAGNYFLDRDGKSFRHILAYLRFKREKFNLEMALPSKPDELTRLVGEADALALHELKEMCVEMLQKYQREEERNYTIAFIQATIRTYEQWEFDKEQSGEVGGKSKKSKGAIADGLNTSSPNYDDWDSMM